MAARILKRLKTRPNRTTPAPPISAMEKVTQTYELLERILYYLDSHSLRLAQLSSHYWHTIIHNSTTLKTRLSESGKRRTVRTLLIGACGVGIDSLVACLILGPISNFPYSYDPTWEPGFQKALAVDNERWMIDGISDGYLDRAYFPTYLGHSLANCETYMLLYSVDSRESFDKVKEFLRRMESPTEPLSMMVSTQERKKSSNDARGKCLLAGLISTKNDLPASQKAVNPSDGAALARELGCPFVETSARTGSGVNDAFVEMCRVYKRRQMEQLRQKSKRSSLIKATVSPSTTEVKERKERWWRWYRAKHSGS